MVPTHLSIPCSSRVQSASSKAMVQPESNKSSHEYFAETSLEDTLVTPVISRQPLHFDRQNPFTVERSDVMEQRIPDDEEESINASPLRARQDSLGSSGTADSDIICPHQHHCTRAAKLTLSAFRRPEQTVRLVSRRGDNGGGRNTRFHDVYDMHATGCRVLGHGAFSTVRLAIRKADGVKVAVKSIAKHEALRARRLRRGPGRRYLEEWEILRRMKDHPYIISLLDVFETDEEVQLVMEYCPGGELFDAIQKKRHRPHATTSLRRGQYYTEPQASRITQQILTALSDLHEQGIVHRDVKPENILLMDVGDDADDGRIHVKLCDFGVARSILADASPASSRGDFTPPTPGRSRAYSMIGSNFYVAPEINCGSSYDTSVDVYSLGVTLYILLCGFPPVFSGSDDNRVIFPHVYWKDISASAKDLVLRMLNPDSRIRISAKEACNHCWIKRLSPQSPTQTPSLSHTCHAAATNMYTVRNRLQTVSANAKRDADGKRRSIGGTPSSLPKKRARMERRASSCLLALADLYRGVASPQRTTRDRTRDAKGMRVNVAALSF